MVFFAVSQLKIISARHILEEAGIKSFVLNKMDSAHAGAFGDIELYVSKEDQNRARHILLTEEIIESLEE